MPRYTFLKSIVFRSIFRGFLRGLSPQNPEGIAQRERSSHPALYLADTLHQLALRLTGIGAEPDLDPGGRFVRDRNSSFKNTRTAFVMRRSRADDSSNTSTQKSLSPKRSLL